MKKAGTIIFAIPFIVFGSFHLMNANQMVGIIPNWMPLGIVLVYLTGLALIAAGVAFIINKQVALTGKLLALMLFIFVLTIHLPGVLNGNQMAMPGLLKDVALAGAALYLSSTSES